MERPQHGERRSPRSGAQSSHRANRRCRRGGRSLHANQRGSAICASGGHDRSVATAGVGGDCGCGRGMGGYPRVPAMFIVAAAVLLYYTFTENLRNSAWGVVVILAGVPIYLYFERKKRER